VAQNFLPCDRDQELLLLPMQAGVSAPAPMTVAADDEQVRRARLLLPDETSRLRSLDRGALAIELDEERQSDCGQ
jgi:hypothetical protein